jgi:hypothetical protein
MVRQFEFNGLPLRRIDNCAFMIGVTGTCYKRANHAWKGMLILELARSGWVNVYHGNLELLNDEDAQWFSRTQKFFHEMQRENNVKSFGAIPGKGEPYGYIAGSKKGNICTVVNPSQQIKNVQLPVQSFANGMMIYHDSGFYPVVKDNMLTVGPEQLVIVGFGDYANKKYDLGTDDDIKIPHSIIKLDVAFSMTGKNVIQGQVKVDAGKDVRILVQQFDENGLPRRSWGGAPPNGKKINEFIKIIARQEGKEIPMRIEYDKMIWSGLSWGAAEINHSVINTLMPIDIYCSSSENDTLILKAEVYAVEYR